MEKEFNIKLKTTVSATTTSNYWFSVNRHSFVELFELCLINWLSY